MSTLPQLPIIDISPYLSNAPDSVARRKDVANALHSACTDFGFFYLNLAGFIDPSTPDGLAALAREFFHLPQEEKDKISLSNQDYARGYQKLRENVTNGKADNHEGIDFYRPVEAPDKSKPLWGENQWPEKPTAFKAEFEDWISKMKELGLIVMKAMADGLGVTEDEWEKLRNQVDDSFWVLRAIGYPPLPDDHDGISCGSHKDYGCLTFLYADPTPSALQVFLNRNLTPEQGVKKGVWINADPIPGCVVCNIGEMWEIWSNGLYKSTLHRVIHRGANYRVSIPFFFEPNFTADVRPLDAALRRQKGQANAKVYEPQVYGEFLMKKVGSNFAGGKKDRY
ncbi:Clavaminate synthase-like protein [Cylindrobasidium torrendii FP15055 ss-10]|uniref:Clavaminate synthase-like protein n=1 Tax=Cylindrobasidium torrendii FP15055 ss-10 TaxID=1314674 RepID=A0A0D7BBD8_9AGAR|nr:Clavaminate synthase-like protein [Cylindrobasidium torrendii FP15055 ss-10]